MASSGVATSDAASFALHIQYVVISFAPPYKHMVKCIKEKQQQKQQLQSLLSPAPELATLDTSLGGLPIIKGEVPLLRS